MAQQRAPRSRGRGTTDEQATVDPPGRWTERASCAGMLPSLLDFFGKTRTEWGTSKRVCKGCPVRRECAGYAMQARLVHGVWGGLDPLELRFALGRDANGDVWAYDRQDVKCLYCRGRTAATRGDGDGTGFVTRACQTCGFDWRRYEPRRAKRGRPRTRDDRNGMKLVPEASPG